MSRRRGRTSPPEPVGARATDELSLRVHLGKADAARLLALGTEEETPINTIRRLIRTAALVQPILEALMQRPPAAASTPPAMSTTPEDTTQRQADALLSWMIDD